MRTVKLSQLSISATLVEIRKINEQYLRQYKECIRQGAVFPSIIVDLNTMMIVSGNHRYHAYKDLYGDKHKIRVITKRFKSQAEILKFFAEDNIAHGNPMDGFTRKKLAAAMLSNSISEEDICTILQISPDKLITLREDIVAVKIGENIEMLPHKEHWYVEKDRVIPDTIYTVHVNSDRGIPIGQQCAQLIRWLNGDFIALSELNIAILKVLFEALRAFFKRHGIE